MVSKKQRPFSAIDRPATIKITGLAACITMLGLLSLACAAADEVPAGPQPVTNDDLNVSFAALPPGFELGQNDAELVSLEPKGSGGEAGIPSRMWVTVDDRSDFGIALTEIVGSQREQFSTLPGGSFGGNQKLGTPSGEAYYSRGQYQFEGSQVEETRVFLVHPTENRLVTFYYRYPADDDSSDRISELLLWVGELAGAGSPQSTETSPTEPLADPEQPG